MMSEDKANLNKQVERAIKFLVKSFEESGANPKPVILHSIRVGMILYDLGEGEEVVLAGFLHDVVEDTSISIEEVEQEFGARVAELVHVNTFDEACAKISEKVECYKKAYREIKKVGRDAIIVKCADTLENSDYFEFAGSEEMAKYCRKKMKDLIDMATEEVGEEEAVVQKLQKKYREITNEK